MEKTVVQIGLEFVFGPVLKDDQLDDGSFEVYDMISNHLKSLID